MLSRLLARDVQSVTGSNLNLIRDLTKFDPWTVSKKMLREALIDNERVEVPSNDRWRLPYLVKLVNLKKEAHLMALEEEEERLNELIKSLVIN